MHESQNKRTRSNFLQRLHLKVLKTKFGSNFFKRVLTSFENLTMLSRALQSQICLGSKIDFTELRYYNTSLLSVS